MFPFATDAGPGSLFKYVSSYLSCRHLGEKLEPVIAAFDDHFHGFSKAGRAATARSRSKDRRHARGEMGRRQDEVVARAAGADAENVRPLLRAVHRRRRDVLQAVAATRGDRRRQSRPEHTKPGDRARSERREQEARTTPRGAKRSALL